MCEITQKAWSVFRSVFADGEDVVLETSSGDFYYGKLTAHNDHVLLTRAGGLSRAIVWEDVEFMAHNGFPVSRLMEMQPDEAARRAEKTSQTVIRELFDDLQDRPPRALQKGFYFGGGCPFVAGPVRIDRVYNVGNRGPRFWKSDACEVMEFRAADGAVMHSYDADHLFKIA